MEEVRKSLEPWERTAVRRMLVRVFISMSQDYALLAKLAARR